MTPPADQSIVVRSALRLRDGGPATATDLARALDVSRTSVENALTALQDAELIVDEPPSVGRGRPARRYAFGAAAGLVAGVDVGVHSIRVVLADLAGAVILQRRVQGLDPDASAATQIEAVLTAITDTVDAAPTGVGALRAVGVSLPGIVDANSRVTASVVLPTWPGIDVADRLSTSLGCPVVMDNGVRLAALAEHHLGAARLVDDVLYVSVGARVAAGIILGGMPRRGAHNVAGDIGRLAFSRIDERTGQIEWASAATAEAVFELAEAGDAAARDELDAFIDDLAHGVATLIMTVDPAMVVVGGGMSLAEEHLLAPLRAAVLDRINLPIDLPIVGARLGPDAPVHGALVFAFMRTSTAVYGLEGLAVPRITPREAVPVH